MAGFFRKIGAAALLGLMGCQASVDYPESIQHELTEAQLTQLPPSSAEGEAIPETVLDELVGDLSSHEGVSLPEQIRFDVNANAVPADVFFASLVDGSPYSAAIHPDVAGDITLNLKQVSMDDVLEIVEQLYGFDVRMHNHIIRVFPAELRTQTFAVNYLLMSRYGVSNTAINTARVSDNGSYNNASEGSNNNNNQRNRSNNNRNNQQNGQSTENTVSNGTNIQTATDTDFWRELHQALVLLVGGNQGRSVIMSPQSGLITVRAMPAELSDVEAFLNVLQSRVQRQVLLEAKVLEVSLSDGFQQGIDWTFVDGNSPSGADRVKFETQSKNLGNEISESLGGIVSFAFNSDNFNAVINLLATQGNVNVLSSPRITASNNQKAVIRVGTDEYFVTGVSSSTVSNDNNTTESPEIILTPFFDGIALDVTPQIDDQGSVLLHVHPSVIEVEEQQKTFSVLGDTYQLPMAKSDVRESDTVIRARSGEVVVIGGLMSTLREQRNSKLPLLGDMPLIGGLFNNVSDAEKKSELVILIRPTIADTDAWRKELQRASGLIQQWYP